MIELLEGWYPDPLNPDRLRFFDGSKWSDDVHPNVSTSEPPQQAGWFPDPLKSGRSRYFDGAKWSDQVRSTVSTPPLDDATGQTPLTPLTPPRESSEAARVEAPDVTDPGKAPVPVTAPRSGSKPLSPRKESLPWKALGLAGLVVLALITAAWFSQQQDITGSSTYQTAQDPPVPAPQPEPLDAPENPAQGAVEAQFSPIDIDAIVQVAAPGWNIREVPTSLDSSATYSAIVEALPGSASGGEFVSLLLYPAPSDSLQRSEAEYLDALMTNFSIYYPYPGEWGRLHCSNLVLIAPGIAQDVFREAIPADITCTGGGSA